MERMAKHAPRDLIVSLDISVSLGVKTARMGTAAYEVFF